MENNIFSSHEELINTVVSSHFKQLPEKIERMKIGMDNEVYEITVSGSEYIIRLNIRDSLKGSSKNIPLFKSLDIKVPEIVAEDYSKSLIPYNWQILTRLGGTDISKVIFNLNNEQLKGIADELASIIKKLATLPTNGMYGWFLLSDESLKPTQMAVAEGMLKTIKNRNEKTGVVKGEYIQLFAKVLDKYKDYFTSAPSLFYFDDMSSKNVIIYNGKFNGLVDLDGMAYGDYCESIGRIKASWYGTSYGSYYANAVMDNLGLTSTQREIVTMWALLNRIYWLAEAGVQFNQNSSKEIDHEKVRASETVIEGLAKELGLN
jgi:aminoglycoside phosphotransferase (APT) family kinase protein